MPEFLSPEWIAELDDALGALAPSESPPEGTPDEFVVEQRVTRAGADDHVHHLVASRGRFRAVAGPAPAADLVLTTDLETAVAIQQGAVNAQLALAAGHLRLGGNLDRLLTHAATFTKLDDVFAALRDRTTYPGLSPSETHR